MIDMLQLIHADGTLGIAIDTHKESEDRAKAADAAIEAWSDDMRKAGWTEEQIEEFLLAH
jgi:hypothetical protein